MVWWHIFLCFIFIFYYCNVCGVEGKLSVPICGQMTRMSQVLGCSVEYGKVTFGIFTWGSVHWTTCALGVMGGRVVGRKVLSQFWRFLPGVRPAQSLKEHGRRGLFSHASFLLHACGEVNTCNAAGKGAILGKGVQVSAGKKSRKGSTITKSKNTVHILC